MERAIKMMQSKGVLAYITPDTYIGGGDTQPVRDLLLQNGRILEIKAYSEKEKVFKNITQAVAICIWQKGASHCDFIMTVPVIKPKVKEVFRRTDKVFIADILHDIKHRFAFRNKAIYRMCLTNTTFNDVCTGGQGDMNLTNKAHYIYLHQTVNSLPLVRGNQIQPYCYTIGCEWCNLKAVGKNYAQRMRIAFQEVSNAGLQRRIKGTLLSNVILGHTCNFLFPESTNVLIEYVLGILNSKAVNFFFKFFNRTNHVPIGEIKQIPFPLAGKETQRQICDTVNKIIEVKQTGDNVDTSALETEIDRIVYDLYGLTEEEIKIVEGE